VGVLSGDQAKHWTNRDKSTFHKNNGDQTMPTLTVSPQSAPEVRPLLQSALNNERQVIQAGIHQTELRLRQFERQFGRTTAEFLRQYDAEQLEETLEYDDWIGESRLLSRRQNQLTTLRDLRIEN
jgi:ferritin